MSSPLRAGSEKKVPSVNTSTILGLRPFGHAINRQFAEMTDFVLDFRPIRARIGA